MNERFVCVKVDREERPDVDAIYMDARAGDDRPRRLAAERVPHARRRAVLRRHLLPAASRARACRAGAQVLEGVAQAWREQREEIDAAVASGSSPRLQAPPRSRRPTASSTRRALDARGRDAARAATTPSTAAGAARRSSRPRRRSSSCSRRGEREMALHTLRAMARGGMYDQVGGGFARYSVDARWVVPHFEKMLYDNALLARAYLHALAGLAASRCSSACATRDARLGAARAAPGRRAASPRALDADSEGVEGKFYVWTPDEVRAALGDELAPARDRALRA